MNLFGKLKEGLAKTRENLLGRVGNALTGRKNIDDDLLDDIEEILIQTDMGVDMTAAIIDRIRDRVSREKAHEPEKILPFLKEEVGAILSTRQTVQGLRLPDQGERPFVILMVGVNGTGKTTTIGKLAYRFRKEGRRVLLAAADTFRAAAIEQLDVWARRSGADLVRHQMGADAASVVYDSFNAAQARGVDVLIIDTAGRLQTKVNLMEEVKKMKRVLAKQREDAPHEILLVLDATTGQNGISQARLFHEALNLTGIVLTKLDGTAKGGIVIAIHHQLDIPVKMIGVGEDVEDLRDFDPKEFVEALFG